jgi:two-component system, NarL family, response regulator NreC
VGRIRVLLAEDHETVRQGLSLLINGQDDMEVVGEAANGRVAVESAGTLAPDVAVLDVSMPEMGGMAATRVLTQQRPAVAVVALTRYSDDAYVQALLAAGASGYVLKQSSSTELLAAIRAAATGTKYLDGALTTRVAGACMARRAQPRPEKPRVSEREHEVLRLMALGYSNKEIAIGLDLSVKTVEVHKSNAMRKLNLRGRIDIVRYALAQGWLKDP